MREMLTLVVLLVGLFGAPSQAGVLDPNDCKIGTAGFPGSASLTLEVKNNPPNEPEIKFTILGWPNGGQDLDVTLHAGRKTIVKIDPNGAATRCKFVGAGVEIEATVSEVTSPIDIGVGETVKIVKFDNNKVLKMTRGNRNHVPISFNVEGGAEIKATFILKPDHPAINLPSQKETWVMVPKTRFLDVPEATFDVKMDVGSKGHVVITNAEGVKPTIKQNDKETNFVCLDQRCAFDIEKKENVLLYVKLAAGVSATEKPKLTVDSSKKQVIELQSNVLEVVRVEKNEFRGALNCSFSSELTNVKKPSTFTIVNSVTPDKVSIDSDVAIYRGKPVTGTYQLGTTGEAKERKMLTLELLSPRRAFIQFKIKNPAALSPEYLIKEVQLAKDKPLIKLLFSADEIPDNFLTQVEIIHQTKARIEMKITRNAPSQAVVLDPENCIIDSSFFVGSASLTLKVKSNPPNVPEIKFTIKGQVGGQDLVVTLHASKKTIVKIDPSGALTDCEFVGAGVEIEATVSAVDSDIDIGKGETVEIVKFDDVKVLKMTRGNREHVPISFYVEGGAEIRAYFILNPDQAVDLLSQKETWVMVPKTRFLDVPADTFDVILDVGLEDHVVITNAERVKPTIKQSDKETNFVCLDQSCAFDIEKKKDNVLLYVKLAAGVPATEKPKLTVDSTEKQVIELQSNVLEVVRVKKDEFGDALSCSFSSELTDVLHPSTFTIVNSVNPDKVSIDSDVAIYRGKPVAGTYQLGTTGEAQENTILTLELLNPERATIEFKITRPEDLIKAVQLAKEKPFKELLFFAEEIPDNLQTPFEIKNQNDVRIEMKITRNHFVQFLILSGKKTYNQGGRFRLNVKDASKGVTLKVKPIKAGAEAPIPEVGLDVTLERKDADGKAIVLSKKVKTEKGETIYIYPSDINKAFKLDGVLTLEEGQSVEIDSILGIETITIVESMSIVVRENNTVKLMIENATENYFVDIRLEDASSAKTVNFQIGDQKHKIESSKPLSVELKKEFLTSNPAPVGNFTSEPVDQEAHVHLTIRAASVPTKSTPGTTPATTPATTQATTPAPVCNPACTGNMECKKVGEQDQCVCKPGYTGQDCAISGSAGMKQSIAAVLVVSLLPYLLHY